jgi:LPXTG-motif cell wall-anchored protein
MFVRISRGNSYPFDMRKLTLTLIALALFAVPAASAFAQGNSGTDVYEESPPTVDDPDGDGIPGTSGDTGTPTPTSTGTGVASETGTIPGDTNGDGVLSEAEAGSAGTTASGQLPATGLDSTLAMALVGAALLAAGLVLRKRVAGAP